MGHRVNRFQPIHPLGKLTDDCAYVGSGQRLTVVTSADEWPDTYASGSDEVVAWCPGTWYWDSDKHQKGWRKERIAAHLVTVQVLEAGELGRIGMAPGGGREMICGACVKCQADMLEFKVKAEAQPPAEAQLPALQEGYVYLVRESISGLVKIGRSKNVKKRLRDLGQGVPYEVELLGVLPEVAVGGVSLEKRLHAEFASQRTRGEWFILSRGLLERFGVEGTHPACEKLATWPEALWAE